MSRDEQHGGRTQPQPGGTGPAVYSRHVAGSKQVRIELVSWADARLSELIEAATERVVAELPGVYDRRGARRVPRDELRDSITLNLRALLAALADPDAGADTGWDLNAPRATGSRRARQGVPLPEVLRVYRISFATLWSALADHARRAERDDLSDELLTLAENLWTFADEHAVALTEAYRATTAELLVASSGAARRSSRPC